MAPVSHITISPADKEKIYPTVQMLIRRMREYAGEPVGPDPEPEGPTRQTIRADILEQVICQGQSELNEVARRVGFKPDDELFTDEWQWAAELVAEQIRLT